MSRTIEAIMAHMAPAKCNLMPVHANRLTANVGKPALRGRRSIVQRKLRLAFSNVAVPSTCITLTKDFMQDRQFISNGPADE